MQKEREQTAPVVERPGSGRDFRESVPDGDGYRRELSLILKAWRSWRRGCPRDYDDRRW